MHAVMHLIAKLVSSSWKLTSNVLPMFNALSVRQKSTLSSIWPLYYDLCPNGLCCHYG